MDHRQIFYGLIFFLWTANILFANQAVENGLTDESNLASSYFFYQRSEYPRDCKEVQDLCTSANASGIHLIKPDGYPEPFDVFCENNEDSGGWTVIQRREDGLVYFGRNWTDYKLGFGFGATEFWLGNDKISCLTNQKKYELRIDFTSSNGTSFYALYNFFRISDEESKYNLASVGEYSGTEDMHITWCRINTGYGNCACQKSCENPHECLDTCDDEDICICPEEYYLKEGLCVPKEKCGCYAFEGILLPEGEVYANSDCTRLATCTDGKLRWNDLYQCREDEVCEVRNNTRQCYCSPGSIGDGEGCITATDCWDVFHKARVEENGVYKIKPTNWPGGPFEVYCNMTVGGGWTVFQRRVDNVVDFYRNWTNYTEGFGSLEGGHWLGNKKLHFLTNAKRYELRVDLVNREGAPYYANFDYFRIGDEDSKFTMTHLGTFTGDADPRSNADGVALRYHFNQPFSTWDQDNDAGSGNCADSNHGAWWYKNCDNSDLNSDYHAAWGVDQSIEWSHLPGSGYNILYTEMKIRPFFTDSEQ